jgi:hypothetical protein
MQSVWLIAQHTFGGRPTINAVASMGAGVSGVKMTRTAAEAAFSLPTLALLF